MKVNIGGDRLGSGNKMNTELHNYSRSNHDLDFLWQSSMAPGVLYPFMCIPALNGDTFDIKLNALCRTIPTQGPLFGSFKLQFDVFQVPMRLYQGLLHNNPIKLGLNMNKVYMPKVTIGTTCFQEDFDNKCQFSTTSLMKYLGLSGIGYNAENGTYIERKINAIPMLAYYDIFKNYYANKQEDNAFVIIPDADHKRVKIKDWFSVIGLNTTVESGTINKTTATIELTKACERLYIRIPMAADPTAMQIPASLTLGRVIPQPNKEDYLLEYYKKESEIPAGTYKFSSDVVNMRSEIKIEQFTLENIDKMREDILSQTSVGVEYIVNGNDAGQKLPYKTIWETLQIPYGSGLYEMSGNHFTMNGLCLKTYQSDMFNAFINAEWIEGENSISELTKVDTSSGSFTMDVLNLQQKLYNMLNRIAVSGGTYQDWQRAVYSQDVASMAETPIYCGGLSKEIVFEEVVSTAETTSETDKGNLGSLGGRGTLSGKHKGGKCIIKVNEPSFIMGIVSITPRVSYSQGNEWYLTELDTFDDLHKPALDGIGFEDLIGERMAWWDTEIIGEQINRNSYGKLPAWINYMTNFDKTFGDFAETNGKSYMVLNRNYERAENAIADATTYIDPRKFNYAFAYSELAAQNFWLSAKADIFARRVMSAKIIPNL